LRTFETTHPWIDFRPDFKEVAPEIWMALGEARSKIEHIAGVPLPPNVQQRLNTIFLARGALATTAIEGNTLSESDVVKIVEGQSHLPASQAYLQQEVENILEACRLVDSGVRQGSLVPLDVATIRRFNAIVLHELEHEDEVEPGQTRKHSVLVGNVYRGAPAEDCDYLLERLCGWLNEEWFDGRDGWGLAEALLKAIIGHLYIAWIHPFGDGNGRTARLVEYLILVNAGVPCLAGHLLSNHYNKTRTAYYRELDRASKENGGVVGFARYALQGLVDELRLSLDEIRSFQRWLVWSDYVDEVLGHERTAVRTRQLQLMGAVSSTNEMTAKPVPIASLRTLSPALEVAYAGKTQKTVTRDINTLVAANLLRREHGGLVANIAIVDAFRPLRASQSEDA
jgi:Fic family protein